MKTILITGASGGIGSEIAKKFTKSKNNVVLIYNHNKEEISKFKQQFSNCNLEIFQCDLTKTEQIKNMVEQVIKTYGSIDCLVNCAGMAKFQQIQDTTDEDFIEVFNTNLKSVVMLIATASKYMIAAQKGKIVNISSMWGVVGASVESLYSATKGAINTLTLSLAKELGPSNITVNAVCPGLIKTQMNKDLDKKAIKQITNQTPLGRMGKPEEVADLVAFLCDEKADFITGQIITIDGGLTL